VQLGFKTARLEGIRLLVRQLVIECDPSDQKLLSIDRSSGLLAELHVRILSRFEIPSSETKIAS
jgi:hypothetical protein